MDVYAKRLNLHRIARQSSKLEISNRVLCVWGCFDETSEKYPECHHMVEIYVPYDINVNIEINSIGFVN